MSCVLTPADPRCRKNIYKNDFERIAERMRFISELHKKHRLTFEVSFHDNHKNAAQQLLVLQPSLTQHDIDTVLLESLYGGANVQVPLQAGKPEA